MSTRTARFALDDTGAVKESHAKAQHELLESDFERCWYQPQDYEEFRNNAKRLGRIIAEETKTNTSRSGITGHRSYVRTMTRVYKSSLETSSPRTHNLLSRSVRKDLEYWVQVDETPRGIERYALPSIKEDRMQLRAEVIAGVLLTQQECRKRAKYLSNKVVEKLVRDASVARSQYSVRLAIVLAAADAAVVSKGYSQENNPIFFLPLVSSPTPQRPRPTQKPTRNRRIPFPKRIVAHNSHYRTRW